MIQNETEQFIRPTNAAYHGKRKMKIHETCACGERFEMDSRDWNDVVQKHDAWLEAHKDCKPLKPKSNYAENEPLLESS